MELYFQAEIGNGKNQLLYTLGLGGMGMTKEETVEMRIDEMDREFDLVMIMEQFDESLVLLANGTNCF